MQTVLIVIHLMVVTALVVVVLLQRSEGGALGMGGGSGFMTGRGQANVLTRATAILATLFFLTSIGLTLLANYGKGNRSILENLPAPTGTSEPAPTPPAEQKGSVLDQLRKLQEQRANGGQPTPAVPSAPSSTSIPAAPKAVTPAEPTGMPQTPADRPKPAPSAR